MPELIVFGNNEKVKYFSDCTLRIDANQLEIVSDDEGDLNSEATFL